MRLESVTLGLSPRPMASPAGLPTAPAWRAYPPAWAILLSLVLVASGLPGCSTPTSTASSPSTTEPGAPTTTNPAPRKPQSPAEKPKPAGVQQVRTNVVSPPVQKYPQVIPVNLNLGRVVSYNAKLRFVVLDYTLSQLPPRGKTVCLYRDGAKTGSARIVGPSNNTSIIADLLDGDARIGDEARDE